MMMEFTLPPAKHNQRQVRVLIVDDTPQVRHDLHRYLDLIGEIQVIGEAADGQEAVRLAAELSPDVILMDLEMPGMDGFEATRLIKAQGSASRIVVLSIHASSEDVVDARSSGADEFIAKGANFQVLINAILGKSASPDLTNS